MRRRSVGAAVAVLALAASTALIVGLSTHHSSSSARARTPLRATQPASGAVAFAVHAVRALNSPAMLDPAYRADELTAYLAPSARNLASRFTPAAGFEQVTALTEDRSSGRPTIAAVVPIAVSTTALTASSAHISVWAVSVVGTAKLGQLVESWSTESLVLQRSGGRWLLTQYNSSPGPVPSATQSPTPIGSALVTTKSMQEIGDDSQP
jgi:hypothetical protein